MSRLILVFLAMISLVSFVQGKRFVAYNNFTLIPAPFTRELNVSRGMYQVKLFQNGPDPLCNWEIKRFRLFLAEIDLFFSNKRESR